MSYFHNRTIISFICADIGTYIICVLSLSPLSSLSKGTDRNGCDSRYTNTGYLLSTYTNSFCTFNLGVVCKKKKMPDV